MSAFQMHLEKYLEDAVLAGALTLAEAWQLQDVTMCQLEELQTLPKELSPLAEKLFLFEAEAPPTLQ